MGFFDMLKSRKKADAPSAAANAPVSTSAQQAEDMPDTSPVYRATEDDTIAHFEEIQQKIYPYLQTENAPKTILLAAEDGREEEVLLPRLAFMAGLAVYFAADTGETFQVINQHMMPEGLDDMDLLELACENLVRDVTFELTPGNFGGYGIVASDENHVASCILLADLWEEWASTVGDNLVISIPGRETVLIAPAGDTQAVNRMKSLSESILKESVKPLTLKCIFYDRAEQKFFKFMDKLFVPAAE